MAYSRRQRAFPTLIFHHGSTGEAVILRSSSGLTIPRRWPAGSRHAAGPVILPSRRGARVGRHPTTKASSPTGPEGYSCDGAGARRRRARPSAISMPSTPRLSGADLRRSLRGRRRGAWRAASFRCWNGLVCRRGARRCRLRRGRRAVRRLAIDEVMRSSSRSRLEASTNCSTATGSLGIRCDTAGGLGRVRVRRRKGVFREMSCREGTDAIGLGSFRPSDRRRRE